MELSKELREQLQKDLETKKKNLEAELSSFADKDKNLKDDWDTKYPRVPEATQLEEAQDEVEQYEETLPVEYSLETQLQRVNNALKKLAEGTYGKCEKCGKEISQERLLAMPEAPLCQDCEKK